MLQRQHSRPAPTGFTLVELVIVLMITGIMAAAAAPRYWNAMAIYGTDAAAQRIAADLNLARDHAQQTSAAHTVDFYLATNRYVLTSLTDFDHSDQTYEVRFNQSEYGVTLISANFGGTTSVTFDIYGRPNNAGTIQVQSGSTVRQIDVGPTGVISIP